MATNATPSTSDLHVVLGASGGIGGAVVRELVGRGRRVRAVNRAANAHVPAGVERLAADLATAEGAKAAAAGAAVVYHCAQPPYTNWPAAFPPLTEAIVDGAAAAGAKLVLADNLYLYGPHAGPLTEDLPAAATGPKGRVRAQIAERLLAAHRQGRLRVAIGRASNYYGPGGLASVTGERLFGAAVTGKTVRWVGRLDQPHSLSYLEDVAAGLAVLGERDEADGQAWHLPAAEPLTGRQFLELVVAATGGRSTIATNSAAMTRLAGLFVPMIREVGEVLYEFQAPYVLDWSKFGRAFGPFTPTPHAEAVARTVAWFRTGGARKAADGSVVDHLGPRRHRLRR
jgi:nucleoside-diphosphate-sugar epimerase